MTYIGVEMNLNKPFKEALLVLLLALILLPPLLLQPLPHLIGLPQVVVAHAISLAPKALSFILMPRPQLLVLRSKKQGKLAPRPALSPRAPVKSPFAGL